MHDVDPRIVALMFAQLVFNLGRISDQIELTNLFVITQRHNGAGNEVRRAKITAHRIEGDLHRCESLRGKPIDCKAKFVAASLREAWLELTSSTGRRLPLLAFQRQDLPATVIAARWAGDVRWQAASALRTFVELRRVPVICCFPRAQSHL
jgi:hypothetical protein